MSATKRATLIFPLHGARTSMFRAGARSVTGGRAVEAFGSERGAARIEHRHRARPELMLDVDGADPTRTDRHPDAGPRLASGHAHEVLAGIERPIVAPEGREGDHRRR